MEQETGFTHGSPLKIRRQLMFTTPSRKMRFQDPRSEEIQKSPKCKMSKSKVLGKISKNKIVIDFDIEKNYFLDQIDTAEYFRAEEETLPCPQEPSYDTYDAYDNYLLSTNAKSWHYASPYKTIKKPRITSANINEFTSVIKETKGRKYEESPFCHLLNESDNYSAESYQTFPRGAEFDEPNETLLMRYSNQIQTIERLFNAFQERSSSIMDLFGEDATFEIIDEPKVHSLSVTLNAIAKVFLKFTCEAGLGDFNYKFAGSEDEREIIITTTGKLISNGFEPDFILSAKISTEDSLIRYAKLKIC